MTLKALFLGVDGTLAETADVRRAAFNQAFDEFGLNWIWARPAFHQIQINAPPGQEIAYYGAHHYPEDWKNLQSSGQIPQVIQRQSEIYLDLLEAGAAQLRPGIARLLAAAIDGGLAVMLCSTRPRLEYETLLFNRFGLEMIERLSGSVAIEDLGTCDVRSCYRLALRRSGLHPREVLTIEDSAAGLDAAARLGITTLITPSQYTVTQHFKGARLVLSDLGHPAAPFNVLQGDAARYGYVTLEALRQWHADSLLQPESSAA